MCAGDDPTRRRRSAWMLLAAMLAAGCAADRPAERTADPPASLTFVTPSEVERSREQKDDEFRSSADSPIPASLRGGFDGLEYYPFDPELRFRVQLEPEPDPPPIKIVTTEGEVRPAVRLGWLNFELAGEPARLAVYQLRDVRAGEWGRTFLPFQDATTGVETYPAGRYVELLGGEGGWYVLDFNLAYHPLCAYGRAGYRCPRTPAENRLSQPVRAGERGWAKADSNVQATQAEGVS